MSYTLNSKKKRKEKKNPEPTEHPYADFYSHLVKVDMTVFSLKLMI